jgi:hypothetical protein
LTVPARMPTALRRWFRSSCWSLAGVLFGSDANAISRRRRDRARVDDVRIQPHPHHPLRCAGIVTVARPADAVPAGAKMLPGCLCWVSADAEVPPEMVPALSTLSVSGCRPTAENVSGAHVGRRPWRSAARR